MNTGSLGTFVISWSQTEIDGLKAARMDLLTVGTVWRWTGTAVRVDGPQGLLRLNEAEGAAELRKRAARMVRRLVGAAVTGEADLKPGNDEPVQRLPDQSFIVTDGHQSFTITIIAVPDTGAQLLMFIGDLPPSDQDLWVVRTSIDRSQSAAGARAAGGGDLLYPRDPHRNPRGGAANP